jgi:RNA polymerase sigma-70 factor (ECF subfamily)
MYFNQMSQSQGKLHGFISSMHRYKDEVDDILQETNITLVNKQEEFDESRNFLPWAFSIARFTLLAHRKKRARDLKRLSYDSRIYDFLSDEEDEEIRDDILYDAEVERLRLVEMIRLKLGAKSRFVFDCLLEGKSCSVIAEEMGRKVRGIHSMRYRVIQSAKKILLNHKEELLNNSEMSYD